MACLLAPDEAQVAELNGPFAQFRAAERAQYRRPCAVTVKPYSMLVGEEEPRI
jgi:hypothetical protein